MSLSHVSRRPPLVVAQPSCRRATVVVLCCCSRCNYCPSGKGPSETLKSRALPSLDADTPLTRECPPPTGCRRRSPAFQNVPLTSTVQRSRLRGSTRRSFSVSSGFVVPTWLSRPPRRPTAGVVLGVGISAASLDAALLDWALTYKTLTLVSFLLRWIIRNVILLTAFFEWPVAPYFWGVAAVVIIAAPLAIVAITKLLEV